MKGSLGCLEKWDTEIEIIDTLAIGMSDFVWSIENLEAIIEANEYEVVSDFNQILDCVLEALEFEAVGEI